jgi:2-oxoisovalerate dehydrogenase E2 component (dihydrolipoyl transacylase)
MSEYVFKLPDLGEGTVEAEIVEWHVKPGDAVTEGDIIADVMTDKANVEVPAPVTGTVLRTSGEPGDLIAVGAELAAFSTTAAAANTAAGSAPATEAETPPAAAPEVPAEPVKPVADTAAAVEKAAPAAAPAAASAPEPEQPTQSGSAAKVITSPAIRKRAKEAGLDLSTVTGSGPRGRILRKDLDAALNNRSAAPAVAEGVGAIEEIKVIGVRRVIANRLQASKREIPHFAYVEEVDITALESLRRRLNASSDQPALTYLPFIALGLIRALQEFPQANALFNAEAGVIQRYERVHLGIATQTPDGLKVPVVHNASSRSLWDLAAEISRVAEAARSGSAKPAELSGSTITLTSLGKLGGIASTPVINSPEVAIIGINKAVARPMIVDGEIAVRLMMNLSSSFDHRFIDGYDAASLIALLKDYLEEPALLFIDSP